MPTSTRFAVAVHTLTALAVSGDKPLRSEALASSVSTGPVVGCGLLSLEDTELFTLHRTPPAKDCMVGSNIQAALSPALERARRVLETELSKFTIADIAAEIARLGKFVLPIKA